MTEPQTLVRSQDRGSVRWVTFGDAERRNALSAELLASLTQALSGTVETGIRAIILTAEPVGGVWSAGHNIDELPSGDRDPLTWDNPLEAALRAIRDTPCPVIGAIEGSVWGGASDLVLTCDYGWV